MELVGDWWTTLILRDATYGLTRFDEFERSLGISPNILSSRLKLLVENGFFERRLYIERPPRYEYIMTQATYDFRIVIFSLLKWGNEHLGMDEPSIVVRNGKTGEDADPIMIDRRTGTPLLDPSFHCAPGPGASERVRWLVEARRNHTLTQDGHVDDPDTTDGAGGSSRSEPRHGRTEAARRSRRVPDQGE